jgi:hypothetical protein
MMGCTLIIPALGEPLKQEDGELEASLSYLTRPYLKKQSGKQTKKLGKNRRIIPERIYMNYVRAL